MRVFLFALTLTAFLIGTEGRGDVITDLYERSDLILLGTFPFEEEFDGFIHSGPVESPRITQVYFGEFAPRMRVISILKGTPPTKDPLRISLTIAMSDKDATSFKPAKNQQYLVFLEDRLKREPKSNHTSGGETLFFRTFDSWFGVLPATQATIVRLNQLNQSRTGSSSLSKNVR